MDITTIDVKQQINQYYKTYSLYVIESRGIPNFYDSLTPVQRLIMLNAPDTFKPTVGLIGAVMQTGLYHHGDMSLGKAINKLTKPFSCSERLLLGDGFFGSPVSPKAASPRYTKVKIAPLTKTKLFEYYDINVKNTDGGFDWLHLDIPLGLASHIVGIAVGYSSNILPRKLSDLKEYMEGKPKQMKPYFDGFGGTIKKHNGLANGWLIEGVVEVDDAKMTIKIGDLPPMLKYSSFTVKMFEKLKQYGDECRVDNDSKNIVDITVKWKNKDTWELVRDAVVKLTKTIVIEGLVFVKDGSVIEYDSITDYLDEFRIHRERVIYKYMMHCLDVSNDELEYLRAKREFLIYMMEKKRKADEIKAFISKYNVKIRTRLDSIKLTALSPETVKVTEQEITDMLATIKDQTKGSEVQLKKCKDLEKGFVGKGRVNMKATPLFDEMPTKIDGIDIFTGEEEQEEEETESDETED